VITLIYKGREKSKKITLRTEDYTLPLPAYPEPGKQQQGSSGLRRYEEFFVGAKQEYQEYKEQMEPAKPKELPNKSHSPASNP
jgi:hypothetical protein